MTIFTTLGLFCVMLSLAALPSASVALVVSRSATHGVLSGAFVAAGIVAGDLIFVMLAVLGMTMLAETLGTFFVILKYAGGAYLIWMGIRLIQSRNQIPLRADDRRVSTLFTSFAAGLLLTLGDVKAIVFYASLFPAFIDLTQLTRTDVLLVIFVTVITVGGVKFAYACAAHRIVRHLKAGRSQIRAKKLAGALLVGAGAYLISKA